MDKQVDMYGNLVSTWMAPSYPDLTIRKGDLLPEFMNEQIIDRLNGRDKLGDERERLYKEVCRMYASGVIGQSEFLRYEELLGRGGRPLLPQMNEATWVPAAGAAVGSAEPKTRAKPEPGRFNNLDWDQ